ncbi:MAG: ankyrin repeat domain-containing protein, partial [Trueperaceae bacterium]|nr:ankyrin repeat domain-containing protein [Trueperaceae bacterium]
MSTLPNLQDVWTMAKDGDAGAFKAIIETHSGRDLEQRDPQGFTPLCLAVKHGSVDVVRALLDAGVDPNEPSLPGRLSPLSHAVAEGSAELVAMLVAAGANIDDVDANGATLMEGAASRKHGDEAIAALVDAGADVN